jgi:ubiquitin-conjugating enzyme E2 J1
MANARHPMIKRLLAELRAIESDPDPNFVAGPIDDDLTVWHFSIRGPRDTPFEGGIYHGKIVFPSEYPYKPPDLFFLTPNGRFECNRRICLNMTSFHPESWQPSWNVGSLLTALIAFLPTRADGIGALPATDDQRRHLARESHSWRCPLCSLGFDEPPPPPAAEPEPAPAAEAAPAAESERVSPRKPPARFAAWLDVPIILIFIVLVLLAVDTQIPFLDRVLAHSRTSSQEL